jgi:predicted DNA-binding transcriptional regulator AlpA
MAKDFDKGEVFTPEELAAKYKLPGGRAWVYEQARKKGPDAMPRLKIGKYVRIPRAEFEAWIRERGNS